MRTFVAQLIYRIDCADVKTEQYEEQWRLIFAADADSALSNAKQVAAGEECIFVDRHGRTVQWKLIAVKDIQEIVPENGALLVSTVREVGPIADAIWKM
jgi:hypothetical protein